MTIATDVGVPRSTARGWLRQPPQDVLSLDVATLTEQERQHEVVQLHRRVGLEFVVRPPLAAEPDPGRALVHESKLARHGPNRQCFIDQWRKKLGGPCRSSHSVCCTPPETVPLV